MRGVIFPILLIMLGAGWLMNSLDIFPSVSWLIILGLCSAGLAVLAIEGVNKSTVVVGPMLIAAGATTFLRQQYQLPLSIQWPILMILCGLLMLLAKSNWIAPANKRPKQTPDSE